MKGEDTLVIKRNDAMRCDGILCDAFYLVLMKCLGIAIIHTGNNVHPLTELVGALGLRALFLLIERSFLPEWTKEHGSAFSFEPSLRTSRFPPEMAGLFCVGHAADRSFPSAVQLGSLTLMAAAPREAKNTESDSPVGPLKML